MKPHLLFLFLLAWIGSIGAEKETIYVDLAQETVLEKVYFTPVGSLLSVYLDILSYDFDHNGKTKVEAAKTFCDYELTLSLEGNALSCRVTSLSDGKGKLFEIQLANEVQKDRQAIHQLSDTIYKALFHAEGVASSRFLYTKRQGEIHELWEADYDGANRSLITRQGQAIVTPCRLNKNCLFVSYQMGEPKLYITPLKEFKPKRASLLKGNQLTPAISPAKDQVAFISDAKGNPDLYLMDLANPDHPRRIYGFPKAAQASPTFSPDGQKIAFVSNKDGYPRIYALPIPPPEQKIRTLKPELLTTLSKESTAPAWSFDGKKLAYSARDGEGIRQIFIYDFPTKKEKQLTFGGVHKENPAWAKDSLHLMYNTVGEQESHIYMLNLNEKTATKIELGQGEIRFPSWG